MITTIRAALESHLIDLDPAFSTAFENTNFRPKTGVPYQIPYLIMGDPQSKILGDGYYREVGIFQVTIRYPLGNGSADASNKAEAIRKAFMRGTVISKNGIDVVITTVPSISLRTEPDSFTAIVKVTFYSENFNNL